ncbi:MAG: phosphopantetheine-binding protein [Opitutaceae bacterium]|nr:phosphopantetheine-binding protein [Opitutaceae bacterium]
MAPAANPSSGVQLKPFTAEDDANLREALKRCSAATYEAAAQFRKTGNTEHLPAIVLGIIERYVEPDLRAKLKDPDDDLRIIEDLGIDSLTMMEIVILVEDVLQMSINNEELRHLRTVGDLKIFIDCKVRGLPLPQPTRFLPIEQIASVMPIQPPFLFLGEASVSAHGANAKYKISGQEFFLQGHFKDDPVLPASIMLEALGQLAVLFLLEGSVGEAGKSVDPKKIFFTSCEGVRCHRICRPGEVLTLSIKPKRLKLPLATFEGNIRVGQEKAAIVEEITLTFAFAEELAQPQPEAAPSEVPVADGAQTPSLPNEASA